MAARLQAREYATARLPVLPTRGKEPAFDLVPHGKDSATRDINVIDGWYRGRRGLGVAVALPPNVVVLDADAAKGGLDTLVALEREIGADVHDTVVQITGAAGRHVWFIAAPDLDLRQGANVLGPGLDVLRRSYAVCAPTLHPRTGRRYEWALGRSPLDRRPASLPLALLERLLKPPAPPRGEPAAAPVFLDGDGTRYGLAALRAEVERVANAIEGTRNDTLNRAAYALAGLVAAGHLREDVVRDALADAARRAGL